MNDPEIERKGLEPDEFEQQVTRSLRRIDAPKGLVARVLERAAASEKPLPARPPLPRISFQKWMGATAAILVLGAVVTNQVRERRERAQIAQIQAQFDTAIRVTDRALAQTRAELERAGIKLGE